MHRRWQAKQERRDKLELILRALQLKRTAPRGMTAQGSSRYEYVYMLMIMISNMFDPYKISKM